MLNDPPGKVPGVRAASYTGATGCQKGGAVQVQRYSPVVCALRGISLNRKAGQCISV
jgi:hypothetical protein